MQKAKLIASASLPSKWPRHKEQDHFRSLARSCGFELRELTGLWRRAQRKDEEAKRQLFRLCTEHPSLSTIFSTLARNHERSNHLRLKALGIKQRRSKPKGAYESVVANAPKDGYVSVFQAGLPSLGKRR
jgi:hypothetical protein